MCPPLTILSFNVQMLFSQAFIVKGGFSLTSTSLTSKEWARISRTGVRNSSGILGIHNLCPLCFAWCPLVKPKWIPSRNEKQTKNPTSTRAWSPGLAQPSPSSPARPLLSYLCWVCILVTPLMLRYRKLSVILEAPEGCSSGKHEQNSPSGTVLPFGKALGCSCFLKYLCSW